MMTRLKIGLPELSYGHVMSKSPPGTCEECNIQFTIRHLLSNRANTRVEFNSKPHFNIVTRFIGE